MLNKPTIVMNPHRRLRNISDNVLYAYQQCKCFYCDEFLIFKAHHYEKRPNGYTLDHVFPNWLGFTLAGNKVLACRVCNELKDNRMPTLTELHKAIKLYHLMRKTFICRLKYPKLKA